MKKIKLLFYLLIVTTLSSCQILGGTSGKEQQVQPSPSAKSQAFLNKLEHDTFNFFWETTNPDNGLTPDRYPDTKFSSVAAVGFALSSYLVGVHNGYITRKQAADRTLTTLRFLWNAPQDSSSRNVTGYKGFYYHFLYMDNGYRYQQVELSTIDTSLLMAGVLSSQTFFNKDNLQEQRIRAYADSLYRRIDWQWAESKKNPPLISMGWRPEKGFIQHDWKGYNEAMILYVLALGSPSHSIPARAWDKWTSTYNWASYQGYQYVNFGPLFGYQYSQVWIDYRGIQDDYMQEKGIDYFENSRRATYANHTYCMKNPEGWLGYSKFSWGLTASDGPGYKKMEFKGDSVVFRGYSARGVSNTYHVDDGTLVPTAAGGSIPFAPDITIPTLMNFYDTYGSDLYGQYGFLDSFNPTFGELTSSSSAWFDDDYLGIDQGPILLMAENYQSDFLWDLMKKNKYIRAGLKKAGFSGGWLSQYQ